MVLEAFDWLKQNNRHYAEIQEDLAWIEKNISENNDLWESMTAEKNSNIDPVTMQENIIPEKNSNIEQVNNQRANDSESGGSSEDDVDEAAESNVLKQQPLDSCIQSVDAAMDMSKILTVAPGEGKLPVDYMMDHGCEELAFPRLLPTGQFGFDAPREKKLSLKKYFNARILNKNGQFAQDLDYLFYAQYLTEYDQVKSQMSIALRKSYTGCENVTLTSSFVRNEENVNNLILKDSAYQFLRTIRGSPPYWQAAMQKLHAAVKQLGMFTFFVTVSAAEVNWTDAIRSVAAQLGIFMTEEEVKSMPVDQKYQYLRSNPVALARHFEHRLNALITKFMLAKSNPLGKVKHYSYR